MLRFFFTGFVSWLGYFTLYLAVLAGIIYLARIGDVYLGFWGAIGAIGCSVGVVGGVLRVVAGLSHDHTDVSGRSSPR